MHKMVQCFMNVFVCFNNLLILAAKKEIIKRFGSHGVSFESGYKKKIIVCPKRQTNKCTF